MEIGDTVNRFVVDLTRDVVQTKEMFQQGMKVHHPHIPPLANHLFWLNSLKGRLKVSRLQNTVFLLGPWIYKHRNLSYTLQQKSELISVADWYGCWVAIATRAILKPDIRAPYIYSNYSSNIF